MITAIETPYPPLTRMTAEEEREAIALARQAYGAGPGEASPEAVDAMEKMVASVHGYICKMAMHRSRQAGTLDTDDLIQAGRRGAVEAIRNYDPARTRWMTYAAMHIFKAIGQEIGNHARTIRVPREVQATRAAIFRAGGDTAMLVNCRHLTKIDGEVLAANDRPADEGTDQEESGAELARLMLHLDERSRRMVSMYYGLGGGKRMTLDAVGREFGVTRERIRQILDKATACMRLAAGFAPADQAAKGVSFRTVFTPAGIEAGKKVFARFYRMSDERAATVISAAIGKPVTRAQVKNLRRLGRFSLGHRIAQTQPANRSPVMGRAEATAAPCGRTSIKGRVA